MYVCMSLFVVSTVVHTVVLEWDFRHSLWCKYAYTYVHTYVRVPPCNLTQNQQISNCDLTILSALMRNVDICTFVHTYVRMYTHSCLRLSLSLCQEASPEEAAGRPGRIKTGGSRAGLRTARKAERERVRGRGLMNSQKARTRCVSRLCRALAVCVCTCTYSMFESVEGDIRTYVRKYGMRLLQLLSLPLCRK